jgi:prepilin-type N-terminal cleavage/methylation domain-containing protein
MLSPKKKGFTLIELLVVIAIIGILAAIVLISVRRALNTAKDGRITAELDQVRTRAEMFAIENNQQYTGLCTNADIVALQNDICAQKGQAAGCGSPHFVCNVSANAYCVYSQLNSGKYWCVDSTMVSKQYDAAPTCTTTDFTCD